MKVFYRWIVIVLVAACISGCIFDSDNSSEDINDTPTLGAIHVGDEAYQAIGCGYDIFGNYADPSEIKGRIIEAYNLPDEWTKKTQLNHTVFSTESGETVHEYQQHLTENANISGSYNAFTGAVKTNFSSDYYHYSNNSFATVMAKINKYQIVIEPSYARADLLRPYISNQASKDLDDQNIDPEHIFMMYGTHVMTGAVMGARLDFSVSMSKSHISEKNSLEVYVEAEFSSKIANIKTDSKFTDEAEQKIYEENRTRTINVIGGKSELSLNITQKGDYDQWVDSIEGSEVFCDYTQYGLIPIWEFCDSSEEGRRKELEEAFDIWASNRQIVTQNQVVSHNCIVDIQVKNSNVGNEYEYEGRKYYKIKRDLNKGAGGKYIYIYTALGKDSDTGPAPVTDVAIVHGYTSLGAKDSKPSGYNLIDTDLNEGAGGRYIYLCYKRDPHGSPIRGLKVWDTSDRTSRYSYGAPSSGYYDAPFYPSGGSNGYDLNTGAGGDYIYLQFSHDITLEHNSLGSSWEEEEIIQMKAIAHP